MGRRWWHLLAVGDFVLPDPALLPQRHRPGEDQAGGRPPVQAHRRHPWWLCRGDRGVTGGGGTSTAVVAGTPVALTCLVDADAGGGHAAVGAEGRDAIARFDGEGVVDVGLQVGDRHPCPRQPPGGLRVADAPVAGPALAALGPALLAGDAVGDVLPAARVGGGGPAQLHGGPQPRGRDAARGRRRTCGHGAKRWRCVWGQGTEVPPAPHDPPPCPQNATHGCTERRPGRWGRGSARPRRGRRQRRSGPAACARGRAGSCWGTPRP